MLAGLASALALALFPSFVAFSRDNNVDALLILLMTLACGVGLRSIESGRLRTLLGCAVLVGLAFNTKTLAAYLVVPGLALGYLVCAPPAPSLAARPTCSPPARSCSRSRPRGSRWSNSRPPPSVRSSAARPTTPRSD